MDNGLSSEFRHIDSLFVMISPRVNSVHLKFHVCFLFYFRTKDLELVIIDVKN
jgi:hypothetical protein